MKRSLILLAALVLVAFALIAIVKRRTAERWSAAEALADADKQRIRTFWQTYNTANALRLQGSFAEAVPAYRECSRLNPKHEDSLYYLGTCLEELGEYAEAATTYRKLIALNPLSGRAYSELGNTLSLVAPGAPADFNQARDAYLRCIDINREQASPFLRLGILDLNQGRYQAALEDFRVAAGFGSPEGNSLLGYTLFLQKKYRESVQPLRKVLGAYAKDRKLTGRGVLSEGDVLPTPGKPLTALEQAGLKSILLLYWAAQRHGGYPAEIPREFQVQTPPNMTNEFQLPAARVSLRPSGGRVAWADFDKDGRADLLVVEPGLPVVLYRNQGDTFLDVTRPAGLGGIRDVWEAVWMDYDHDGFPDLYFIRAGFAGAGQNALYHNNGNGIFTDVTTAMGLQGKRSTARACFADFSGEGRIDLVEAGTSDADHSSVRFFRNVGNRFIEQTQQAGLARPGTAVDCTVADYNHDGKPDVFVLFWLRDGALFANQGHGRFADVTEQAGLKNIRGKGFSALFFDYDRDGSPDLLITTHAPFEEVARCLLQQNYRVTRNTPRLFRNKGNGGFEEVTAQVGLNRCYGTMQVIAADLDSDGWTDLVLVNGSLDAQRLEPSVALHNVKGKEFREWFYVPRFDVPSNFIGAAITNVDRDGQQEMFFFKNPALSAAEDSTAPLVNRLPVSGRKNQPPGK